MSTPILDPLTLRSRYPWDPKVEKLGFGPYAATMDGLSYLIQIREQFQTELSRFSRHPADLMLFALEDEPNLCGTRVGGPALLPSHSAWPATDGNPWIFLAQFDFSDSLDFFPNLPGDLLLIFLDFDEICLTPSEVGYLHFVWEHSDRVRSADSVFPPQGPSVPFVANAQRIRSSDYDGFLDETLFRFALAKFPRFRRILDYPNEVPYLLRDFCQMTSRAFASKIGGLPYRRSNPDEHCGCRDEQFLCSWHSFGVTVTAFGEQRELTESEYDVVSSCLFDAFEGFVMNLYLEEDGNITPELLFPGVYP